MFESGEQEDLKAHLMQTDEEFRELVDQHTKYDGQLQELEAKHVLTEADQLEEVRLKKLKLHLKDQMTQALGRYKAQQVA